MGRVEGKVALITGASSGLGLADAQVLAREGAIVVMTDINTTAGEAAAESIRANGGRASFLPLDVSSEEQWESVIDQVREEHGRLDVLVNNAGMVAMGSPEQCSLESFRKHNSIMSEGVFLGCKIALPLMHETGGGSIINIASIASHLGYPIYYAYSAAKGAVRSMTKAMAVHCLMQGYNIRVNSVHPGGIDTPMVDQTCKELGLESKEQLSPVVGLGQPEDVANVVLFLASDESRWVNGSEIMIDNTLSIQ